MAGLTFVGWQEPIGCGGVAVFPNDVIVADGDGAVVVPASMVDEVAALATEQERLETWIMQEVNAGAALPGLYPPNDENKARYAAAIMAKQEGAPGRLWAGFVEAIRPIAQGSAVHPAEPGGIRSAHTVKLINQAKPAAKRRAQYDSVPVVVATPTRAWRSRRPQWPSTSPALCAGSSPESFEAAPAAETAEPQLSPPIWRRTPALNKFSSFGTTVRQHYRLFSADTASDFLSRSQGKYYLAL